MQKINARSSLSFALLLAISGFAFQANAADAVVDGVDTDTEVVVAAQETTIGRIAKKQRELEELKLDKDIAKIRQEMSPSSTVTLPQTMRTMQFGSENSDHVVTSIFGELGHLRAEMVVDGVPYVVFKGSNNIPGWSVADVQVNRVVIHNGKKTKTVYLSAAAPESASPPFSMPNLPPVANGTFAPEAQ